MYFKSLDQCYLNHSSQVFQKSQRFSIIEQLVVIIHLKCGFHLCMVLACTPRPPHFLHSDTFNLLQQQNNGVQCVDIAIIHAYYSYSSYQSLNSRTLSRFYSNTKLKIRRNDMKRIS